MKITKRSWPVLIISARFDVINDQGFRLRELVVNLEKVQELTVHPSFSYEDGIEILMSRCDLGAVIIDWDIGSEDSGESMEPEQLLNLIRARNRHIPIILLTERLAAVSIPTHVLEVIDDALWKTADIIEFLAGRIDVFVGEYLKSVYPKFFGTLVKYSQEYKYACHTPGHVGGQGFLHSPAGATMFDFSGENVFRADLSISVPELGSLLDHNGICYSVINIKKSYNGVWKTCTLTKPGTPTPASTQFIKIISAWQMTIAAATTHRFSAPTRPINCRRRFLRPPCSISAAAAR